MYEMTVTYNNADSQFRFDEEIRAMMAWRCGEENDSRHNLATHMREITFVFQDEDDVILAAGVLEEKLGDCFKEITWTGRPVETTLTDEPKEPKSTDPVIDLDPSRIPGECPSVLPFSQYAGLKHRNGHRGAREVFDSFADRFAWDFGIQQDVLLNYCGENMVEPVIAGHRGGGADGGFRRVPDRQFRAPQWHIGDAGLPGCPHAVPPGIWQAGIWKE